MYPCLNPVCQELFGSNVNLLSDEDVELFKISARDSWPCMHDIGEVQVQLISHKSNTHKLCNLWIGTKSRAEDGSLPRQVAHLSLDLINKTSKLNLKSPIELNSIKNTEVFRMIITILSKVMSIPEDQILDYLAVGLHHYVLSSPRPSPESLQILINKCTGGKNG